MKVTDSFCHRMKARSTFDLNRSPAEGGGTFRRKASLINALYTEETQRGSALDKPCACNRSRLSSVHLSATLAQIDEISPKIWNFPWVEAPGRWLPFAGFAAPVWACRSQRGGIMTWQDDGKKGFSAKLFYTQVFLSELQTASLSRSPQTAFAW